MGNGPISMSAAAADPTMTAMDATAPDAAPQFFNPNQFAGAAPEKEKLDPAAKAARAEAAAALAESEEKPAVAVRGTILGQISTKIHPRFRLPWPRVNGFRVFAGLG